MCIRDRYSSKEGAEPESNGKIREIWKVSRKYHISRIMKVRQMHDREAYTERGWGTQYHKL